jgi:hypothetical protein
LSDELFVTVSFPGTKATVPGPDRVRLTDLYEQWRAEGGEGKFEVRDCVGKLVAVGLQVFARVRRRPPQEFDVSDEG